MKRRDVITKLEASSFYFLRSGHSHDIYSNGKINIAVPQHREINEITAKQIFKEAGIR